MSLNADTVLALAPDAASAVAGKKLASARQWQNLGSSSAALWGECQGSALYQVRVDLSDLATKCSCPSHKFPCKHGLGLLLLAATTPDTLPAAQPPAWVGEWLDKRAGDGARKEARVAEKATALAYPATPDIKVAPSKRADKRQSRVAEGLDSLDLWMNDLIRHGLATLETQPANVWEKQAARMVDAQAQGIAGRLRRMSAIPNSGPDWPERLLGQLGRLALLSQAFRRLDSLPPALQEDVRGAIGWTIPQEEVLARGERVSDDWAILGQRVNDEERVRSQWTWLYGAQTDRFALILQFAVGAAAFPETITPGMHLLADLVYWPSSFPQRAMIAARRGPLSPLSDQLGGTTTVEGFLNNVAVVLARQPWLERLPCLLDRAIPLRDAAGRWWVRDPAGNSLPLVRGDHWRLLALSGGHPCMLAGEWNGERLLPLGVLIDGAYSLLDAPLMAEGKGLGR